MDANKVGSLEEEALKRKERLKQIRNRKHGDDRPSAKVQRGPDDEPLPKPVFRSYKPIDEEMKENTAELIKPIKVEDRVKEQLLASAPEPLVEEVDLANLAPRKPDWDLKRDVSKKLEKLERRTQRAIAELIRERLKSGKEEDLAAAVDVGVRSTSRIDSDSD